MGVGLERSAAGRGRGRLRAVREWRLGRPVHGGSRMGVPSERILFRARREKTQQFINLDEVSQDYPGMILVYS